MQLDLSSNTLNSIQNIHDSSLVKFYLVSKQKFTNQSIYTFAMNEEAKNFARNLKLLMDHHGDTQQILEKRSGVSQKTISNMLNPGDDRSPNLSKVAMVAAAYKLKVWHLLLPDPPVEILLNQSVEKLIDNYTAIDKESRETVLRVAENSARYTEVEPNKMNSH